MDTAGNVDSSTEELSPESAGSACQQAVPTPARWVSTLTAALCPYDDHQPPTGTEGMMIKSKVDRRLEAYSILGQNQGDQVRTRTQQDTLVSKRKVVQLASTNQLSRLRRTAEQKLL